MVAPLIAAAAIDGGAKLLSAVLGMSSQKKALKQQALESARQYAISQQQLDLSKRMMELGLATQIDANGNVSWYDEATNTWKTVLSDKQQQLADASDAEQIRQYSVDAPLARGELLRTSMRRMQEGGVADGMLRDVTDASQGRGVPTAKALASSMRLARTNAVNKGFDDVGNAVATQALRSGTSGAGAAAALAKARSQAVAETMGNPDLEGLQLAGDMRATKQGNAINNYGAIASRASSSNGYAFTPSNIAPNLSQTLSSLRTGGQQGFGQANTALTYAGRSIQQPGTYNPAPLISALGNGLGSLYDALKQSKFGVSGNRNASSSSGWTYDENDPLGRGGL